MPAPTAERRLLGPRRMPVPGSLGAADRCRLAVEILGTYRLARRELRRASIETVVVRLRAGSGELREEGPLALAESRRFGEAVARTLVLAPGDTRCLVRSLVLTRLLARRGIAAKLVIAARTEPEFLAHAWVEHAGQPVLAPGDSSFGRLVEI